MAVALLDDVVPAVSNSLDSSTWATVQTTLDNDGDTSEWLRVFRELTVLVSGATTYTLAFEMSPFASGADAVQVATQSEDEPGSDYVFSGFSYVRLKRVAATGADPKVTITYRGD
jgi:hypothetical protein